MTITLEELGIHSEKKTPLRTHPSICLYAASGCGKSTEMYVAIQDALILKTSPTVTRPYYSWLRELDRPAYDKAVEYYKKAQSAYSTDERFNDWADLYGLEAVAKPRGLRHQLEEFTVTSTVDNWETLQALQDRFVTARLQGQNVLGSDGKPLSGIIMDEYTEFLRRTEEDMKRSGKFKNKKRTGDDYWAIQDALEAFVLMQAETFRSNGWLLGTICQEAPPQYVEAVNPVTQMPNPNAGQLKYKGGPAVAFGRLRDTICAAMDVVLRITLEDGGSMAVPLAPPGTGTAAQPAKPTGPERWARRRYWTEAHPLWHTKFRDFSISYREELGLRRLLERAGYL